jgi:GNAT superfamily N-acetyltransferase
MIETHELGNADLPSALRLLERAYSEQRRSSPLLPPVLMSDPELALPMIETTMANGCVGAFEGRNLLGFMGISSLFNFKGQRAALINECSHAAETHEKRCLYRSLYAALGVKLHRLQAQLHIIAYFSGDRELTETLYRLGFGAFLAEELRDLSAVIDGPAPVQTACLGDPDRLVELEVEHRCYYNGPPIFLCKDSSRESVRAELRKRQKAGAASYVYAPEGRPLAYFAVGPCEGLEEGRLLRNTNSAQVLSAYVVPSVRRSGVGCSLLNRCVEWARERGYQRLMVEHETANVLGSLFWSRYFSPYLYFSMRYVETLTGSSSVRQKNGANNK